MDLTSAAKVVQSRVGGQIFSGTTTLNVEAILGQGTFGQVVKCVRMDNSKTVAIKLIKNQPGYIESAKAEVETLKKLRMLNVEQSNLVTWHQVFNFRGHTCLEFEYLDKSLYDLMVERRQPLGLPAIRPIIQQIASALYYVKCVGLVHADLKMENVMLVDHKSQPYRVKLIDFGLAQAVSATSPGTITQTLSYRSPEVLLGLPYNTAIDVWSLGCMAASLYLGSLIYPGKDEYEMLWYIEQCQGALPEHLVNNGLYTSQFYRRDTGYSLGAWKLQTPMEYSQTTGKTNGKYCLKPNKVKSLDDFLNLKSITTGRTADKLAQRREIRQFVDMVKGMLKLDAAQRLTPRLVVQHPFITMSDFLSMDPSTSYVKHCRKRMDVCFPQTKPTEAATSSASCSHPGSSCTQTGATNTSQESATAKPSKAGTKRKMTGEMQENTCQDRKRCRISPDLSTSSESPNTHVVSGTHRELVPQRPRSSPDRCPSSDRENTRTVKRCHRKCDGKRPRFLPDQGESGEKQIAPKVKRKRSQCDRDSSHSSPDLEGVKKKRTECDREMPRFSPDRCAPSQRRITPRAEIKHPECDEERPHSSTDGWKAKRRRKAFDPGRPPFSPDHGT